jgi:signal transduction histidine kinase
VRLADFIEKNTEPIIAEWVTFAEQSGPAGRAMDRAALRDHALEMLGVIVADLRTPQSDAAQKEKSKGKSDAVVDGVSTAAEVHGSGRAESGFTAGEMVSEYRALRASVIRLWTRASGTLVGADIEDLMRFNEAIDQALAESITRYTSDIDHSREMFVAILGHDLRGPLGTVTTGAQFMLEEGALDETNLTMATRILRSAKRMNQMVGDLLDFTRGRLGSGIPITRAPTDLAIVARQAIDEIQIAHPDSQIQFTASGDLTGSWDAARLSQLLGNLLGNALQHGAPGTLVTLTARGEAADVVVRLHNYGPPIASSELGGLFSPFKRVKADKSVARAAGSLGLGLYIAERIVAAHGGSIDVRSSEAAGTLFSVRLPRQPATEQPGATGDKR